MVNRYGEGDTKTKPVRPTPSRWSLGRKARKCTVDSSLLIKREPQSYDYGKIGDATDSDTTSTVSGSTKVRSGSEADVDVDYGYGNGAGCADSMIKTISYSTAFKWSSGCKPRRCSLDMTLHRRHEQRDDATSHTTASTLSSSKVSEADLQQGRRTRRSSLDSKLMSLPKRSVSVGSSAQRARRGSVDSSVCHPPIRQGSLGCPLRRGSLDSKVVSPPERNSSFGSSARQARRGSVNSSSAYRPPVCRGSLGRPLRRLSVGTCIRRGSITHNDSMRSLASRESVCGSLHSVHERLARTGQNHGKLDSEMDDSSSTCGTGDASHLKPNDLDDTIADALSLDDSEQFNAGQPGPFRGTLLVAIPTVINT